jgi:hypothetical protein
MAKPAPKRTIEPTAQFSFRLAESAAERADRLLEPEHLSKLSPVWQRVLISRSSVFRECLLRGLADFEADLGLGPLGSTPTPEAKPKPVAKAKGKGKT